MKIKSKNIDKIKNKNNEYIDINKFLKMPPFKKYSEIRGMIERRNAIFDYQDMMYKNTCRLYIQNINNETNKLKIECSAAMLRFIKFSFLDYPAVMNKLIKEGLEDACIKIALSLKQRHSSNFLSNHVGVRRLMEDIASIITVFRQASTEILIKEILDMVKMYVNSEGPMLNGILAVILSGFKNDKKYYHQMLLKYKENRLNLQLLIKNVPIIKSFSAQESVLNIVSYLMECENGHSNADLVDSLHPSLMHGLFDNQSKPGSNEYQKLIRRHLTTFNLDGGNILSLKIESCNITLQDNENIYLKLKENNYMDVSSDCLELSIVHQSIKGRIIIYFQNIKSVRPEAKDQPFIELKLMKPLSLSNLIVESYGEISFLYKKIISFTFNIDATYVEKIHEIISNTKELTFGESVVVHASSKNVKRKEVNMNESYSTKNTSIPQNKEMSKMLNNNNSDEYFHLRKRKKRKIIDRNFDLQLIKAKNDSVKRKQNNLPIKEEKRNETCGIKMKRKRLPNVEESQLSSPNSEPKKKIENISCFNFGSSISKKSEGKSNHKDEKPSSNKKQKPISRRLINLRNSDSQDAFSIEEDDEDNVNSPFAKIHDEDFPVSELLFAGKKSCVNRNKSINKTNRSANLNANVSSTNEPNNIKSEKSKQSFSSVTLLQESPTKLDNANDKIDTMEQQIIKKLNDFQRCMKTCPDSTNTFENINDNTKRINKKLSVHEITSDTIQMMNKFMANQKMIENDESKFKTEDTHLPTRLDSSEPIKNDKIFESEAKDWNMNNVKMKKKSWNFLHSPSNSMKNTIIDTDDAGSIGSSHGCEYNKRYKNKEKNIIFKYEKNTENSELYLEMQRLIDRILSVNDKTKRSNFISLCQRNARNFDTKLEKFRNNFTINVYFLNTNNEVQQYLDQYLNISKKRNDTIKTILSKTDDAIEFNKNSMTSAFQIKKSIKKYRDDTENQMKNIINYMNQIKLKRMKQLKERINSLEKQFNCDNLIAMQNMISNL